MKGSEFVKILRKVIREEVRSVVKEELKSLKPLIAEVVSKQSRVTKYESAPLENLKPKQPIKRTQPIVTMDSLDNMLNEGTFDTEEWPDMNGGPMTSDILAGDSDFGINGFAPQQMQQMQQPRFTNVDMGVGDPLLRDYSKVMKAADQHAQGYRGV